MFAAPDPTQYFTHRTAEGALKLQGGTAVDR